MLDAAAPHAETLPKRADITYFVAHPATPLFNDETDPDARLLFGDAQNNI